MLAMDVNDNAFFLNEPVIVNVHREQARSYRGRIRFTDRHLADEAEFFVECRGKTIHLCRTAFDQTIRTTFSNYRVSRSSGESVHCKNRESDAEKDLAFHDGVLRGVVVWYGGDVTPRSF